ncbi:uncharacterized protein LOC117893993 [Drosophila subobscura]|uniref:uncharacterized protein LOC117893993 n=1 Tax=Drosophila subobscura TaxID=7241 RepID=UPI00155A3AF0|nr:uncharacterized protein LOC117893993 [Drosophila subobscura]
MADTAECQLQVECKAACAKQTACTIFSPPHGWRRNRTLILCCEPMYVNVGTGEVFSAEGKFNWHVDLEEAHFANFCTTILDTVQGEGTQVNFGNPMIVQMRARMTPSKQRIWPMKRLPAEVSEQVLSMCSRSSTI